MLVSSSRTAAIISGQKDLYEEGDIVSVKATPKDGYIFSKWSDGSVANPYNYPFPGGKMNLVAMFEEEDSSH